MPRLPGKGVIYAKILLYLLCGTESQPLAAVLGRGEKRPADPTRSLLRQQSFGMVDLRTGTFLAGICFLPHAGTGLSLLRRPAGLARRDRSGGTTSAVGGTVASDQKWYIDAGTVLSRQSQAGLVALRERTQLAGRDQKPQRRYRLSLLCQPAGHPRRKRLGNNASLLSRAVGCPAKCSADTSGASRWKYPSGLVAL